MGVVGGGVARRGRGEGQGRGVAPEMGGVGREDGWGDGLLQGLGERDGAVVVLVLVLQLLKVTRGGGGHGHRRRVKFSKTYGVD